jgi:quercetin dioxygenase-like cupin family protein
MANVSLVPPEKVRSVSLPPGYSGLADAKAYLDGKSSLHLYLLEIDKGQTLQIEAAPTDRVIYVWRGGVEAGERRLSAGSSIVVEHGRTFAIHGIDDQSQILVFAAADASSQSKAGGHVHLLPAERVPRIQRTETTTGGGMHADSGCLTCAVWLHENSFPGRVDVSAEDEARGIHSHTEDEIIFVIDGEIRLGARICGPGTALAIAANTMYSFTAGSAGLRFVNFRAAEPSDIHFADGRSMSETGYWRGILPRPEYIEA